MFVETTIARVLCRTMDFVVIDYQRLCDVKRLYCTEMVIMKFEDCCMAMAEEKKLQSPAIS